LLIFQQALRDFEMRKRCRHRVILMGLDAIGEWRSCFRHKLLFHAMYFTIGERRDDSH
jgi:hypothetical protein